MVSYLATTGELNLAPAVDFEAQLQVGFEFLFVPDASDTDGSVASYEWNFGDGTSSTEASPLHELPDAGDYLVSLTVADDDGVTTTSWRYINVTGD